MGDFSIPNGPVWANDLFLKVAICSGAAITAYWSRNDLCLPNLVRSLFSNVAHRSTASPLGLGYWSEVVPCFEKQSGGSLRRRTNISIIDVCGDAPNAALKMLQSKRVAVATAVTSPVLGSRALLSKDSKAQTVYSLRGTQATLLILPLAILASMTRATESSSSHSKSVGAAVAVLNELWEKENRDSPVVVIVTDEAGVLQRRWQSKSFASGRCWHDVDVRLALELSKRRGWNAEAAIAHVFALDGDDDKDHQRKQGPGGFSTSRVKKRSIGGDADVEAFNEDAAVVIATLQAAATAAAEIAAPMSVHGMRDRLLKRLKAAYILSVDALRAFTPERPKFGNPSSLKRSGPSAAQSIHSLSGASANTTANIFSPQALGAGEISSTGAWALRGLNACVTDAFHKLMDPGCPNPLHVIPAFPLVQRVDVLSWIEDELSEELWRGEEWRDDVVAVTSSTPMPKSGSQSSLASINSIASLPSESSICNTDDNVARCLIVLNRVLERCLDKMNTAVEESKNTQFPPNDFALDDQRVRGALFGDASGAVSNFLPRGWADEGAQAVHRAAEVVRKMYFPTWPGREFSGSDSIEYVGQEEAAPTPTQRAKQYLRRLEKLGWDISPVMVKRLVEFMAEDEKWTKYNSKGYWRR